MKQKLQKETFEEMFLLFGNKNVDKLATFFFFFFGRHVWCYKLPRIFLFLRFIKNSVDGSSFMKKWMKVKRKIKIFAKTEGKFVHYCSLWKVKYCLWVAPFLKNLFLFICRGGIFSWNEKCVLSAFKLYCIIFIMRVFSWLIGKAESLLRLKQHFLFTAKAKYVLSFRYKGDKVSPKKCIWLSYQ